MHENIKFNFKEEKDGKISFLDLLVVWNNQLLDTTIYIKKTNTNLYLNWNSFEPKTLATLKVGYT